MSRWRLAIITFGGAGLLKPAPGTWGSLAATVTLFLIHWIIARIVTAPDMAVVWPIALVCFILTAGVANVLLGPWIVRNLGDDPGSCVVDEAAGIGLTLLGLRLAHPMLAFALAFGAFRLFDVTKPPPARQLENLPLGWGILLDDLAAAVYANILCQILVRCF